MWLHGTSDESGMEVGDSVDPSFASFEPCVWATESRDHAESFARSRAALGGSPIVVAFELVPTARVREIESLDDDVDSALTSARDEGLDALIVTSGEGGHREIAILTRDAATVVEA